MAEVTWFKVLTDIFADDKIKILQSMPEGDSLLVMWFKVLSQAGKTNDGGYIYLKKNIPYTFGMFATLFGKQQQLVELAMRTFTEFGMIDIDDNGYVFVTNWEKHQSIDKLSLLKEKANVRLKKHRDKKRIELLESNVSATFQQRPSNATEIDLELDLELDLDQEKDKRIPTTTENPFRLFESEGFGTISSIVGDKLGAMIDEYGERWVCEAMKLAVYRGKRSLSYVDGILKSFQSSGIDEPWTLDKKEISVMQGGSTDGGYGKSIGTNKTSGGRVPEEWESLIS